MISESVIIFGSTGNVVVVINGELPKDSPIMFSIKDNSLQIKAEDDVIYSEGGLSAYTCERLKSKNEIGLMEIISGSNLSNQLTNIAYQAA